ncbi:hypothetical protein DFA_08829 [Cavenderia fasciculata]|uniref:Carbohydrate binding domain-containing protein n=1 Tax=Cavenderia fasciculata TaxID=261658 RepID=F4Q4H9_CACFS|nr:uncharacterized protein DFA_08829 [Cavenderia fasciculata]EGG17828.1 hypothetical protein DFA_08829 [Cavenderia fasciculata]|eukprot:XP_004356312.1 hypothetical protein DFA_08829 [Cavenderia fasciculata]
MFKLLIVLILSITTLVIGRSYLIDGPTPGQYLWRTYYDSCNFYTNITLSIQGNKFFTYNTANPKLKYIVNATVNSDGVTFQGFGTVYSTSPPYGPISVTTVKGEVTNPFTITAVYASNEYHNQTIEIYSLFGCPLILDTINDDDDDYESNEPVDNVGRPLLY